VGNSNVDYDFFFDYENGINRYVFKVFVSGVVDFDNVVVSKRKFDRPDPYLSIETKEDLLAVLRSYLSLWSLPFVIIEKHPDFFIVKDKGIRFRSWVYRRRFYGIVDNIPKKWFYIKGGRSRHVVITITLPHENLGIGEAYKLIKKRVRSVISYFNKRYGVKAYLGVWEIHEDGYPHIHLIIFLRKSIPVFLYKGIWRFSHKRLWDKDLKTNQYGFIDCLALRGGRKGVRNYFSKYLSKMFTTDISRDNSINSINFKPYSLFIFRLFRIRAIIRSRNLKPKELPAPTTLEDLKFLNPKEYSLYELGKFIYENKPKDKTIVSILRFESELRKRINDLINISPNLCCYDNDREKIINEALRVFSKWEKRFIALGYTYVYAGEN